MGARSSGSLAFPGVFSHTLGFWDFYSFFFPKSLNALALPQGFRPPPVLPTAVYLRESSKGDFLPSRVSRLSQHHLIYEERCGTSPTPAFCRASRATSLDRGVRGGVNVPSSLRLDLFHGDGPRRGQTVAVRGQMCPGPGPGVEEIPVVLPSSPKGSSLGETFVFWVFVQAVRSVSRENPSEELQPNRGPSLSRWRVLGNRNKGSLDRL